MANLLDKWEVPSYAVVHHECFLLTLSLWPKLDSVKTKTPESMQQVHSELRNVHHLHVDKLLCWFYNVYANQSLCILHLTNRYQHYLVHNGLRWIVQEYF